MEETQISESTGNSMNVVLRFWCKCMDSDSAKQNRNFKKVEKFVCCFIHVFVGYAELLFV